MILYQFETTSGAYLLTMFSYIIVHDCLNRYFCNVLLLFIISFSFFKLKINSFISTASKTSCYEVEKYKHVYIVCLCLNNFIYKENF